jgi:hypothetical protein
MAVTADRPMLQAGFGTPATQNRWTVFFRVILLVPQFFVWLAYGIAAFVLIVIGWFAALVTGRLPASFADILTGYVQYSTRINAYLYLMHDEYPPFSMSPANPYRVNVEVGTGPVRRLAVLFRLFLLVPAAIVASLAGYGLGIAGVFVWLIVLVAGRMPVPLFEAVAGVQRFQARYLVYAAMITSKYPGEIFGDAPGAAGAAPWAAPGTPAMPGTPAAAAMPATTSAPPAPPYRPGGVSAPAPAVPYSEPTPEPAVSAPVPAAPVPAAPAPAPVPSGLGPPPTPPTVARLVLSKPGKRIVAVFLVLGVLGYVGQFALQATLISNHRAYDQLSTLDAQFQSSIAAAQGQRAACTGTPLQCAEQYQTQVAAAFSAFGAGLDAIDFPASASAEVSAVQADIDAIVKGLQQLAASPDEATYNATVSHVQDLAAQFDTDLSALAAAVG